MTDPIEAAAAALKKRMLSEPWIRTALRGQGRSVTDDDVRDFLIKTATSVVDTYRLTLGPKL